MCFVVSLDRWNEAESARRVTRCCRPFIEPENALEYQPKPDKKSLNVGDLEALL